MDRHTFELGRAAGRRTYLASIPSDLLDIIIACSSTTPEQYKQLATNLTECILWDCFDQAIVLEELVEAGLAPYVRDYLRTKDMETPFWNVMFSSVSTQSDNHPRTMAQFKALPVARLCKKIHGDEADLHIKEYTGWNNVCTDDTDTNYDAAADCDADIDWDANANCDADIDWDADEDVYGA